MLIIIYLLTILVKLRIREGIAVELRKMQLIGRGSFSITLPPDWVKENKLKPSDQITITREDDGSLRLVPGIIREEKEELKTTIDAGRYKDPGLLARLIVAAYIRGFDSIEVVSKHPISENHRKEIKDVIGSLMGLGIVESTSNRVMLQSMIDPAKFPTKPLLKRLCGLASSMYEDAMRALNDKDSSLATSVIQRENEVNKVYALLQRQLAAAAFDKTVLKKIELRGTPDLGAHVAILPRIKSIAENAVDIANNQMALGQKEISDSDLQKIIRLGKMTHEIFSNAVEAFFNEDAVLANRTLESIPHFEETTDELISYVITRIKDHDVRRLLTYIVRDLRRISGFGKSIAEVAITGFVFHKSNLT
jgi:phosphate uptake regulator